MFRYAGRVWILSELTPRTLKGQMRLLNFEPDEGNQCRLPYPTKPSRHDTARRH